MATETIKMTYDELLSFRTAAQNYINRNPERTKLHYALEKMIKKTQSHWEDFADLENEIRVDCALTDKDTKRFVMSEDKRNLAADPAKAKELQNRMRKLGRTEIEVEPYFAAEIPTDLEAIWYQFFLGVVIRESDDPIVKEEKKAEMQPA